MVREEKKTVIPYKHVHESFKDFRPTHLIGTIRVTEPTITNIKGFLDQKVKRDTLRISAQLRIPLSTKRLVEENGNSFRTLTTSNDDINV